MEIDWQTVFYVISTVTMLALLIVLSTIFIVFRKIKSGIEKSVAGAAAVKSLAKISMLKMLLKIMR